MAFKHGSKAIFFLRDGIPGAGSLRNLSTYIATTGLPGPIDTAEVSTLGSFSKKYVGGLIDHTFPLDGPWSQELDEWLFSLVSASAYADFDYAPAGSVTGYPHYTGSCMLTSYEITTDVGDAAKFTAAFQVSGSVARAVL